MIIDSVVSGHLAELVHGDDPVPITVKQFEGLLEAVDVLARQLPVRAEPLRVLRHAVLQRSSLTGSPSDKLLLLWPPHSSTAAAN